MVLQTQVEGKIVTSVTIGKGDGETCSVDIAFSDKTSLEIKFGAVLGVSGVVRRNWETGEGELIEDLLPASELVAIA